jgi:hypothetical protein
LGEAAAAAERAAYAARQRVRRAAICPYNFEGQPIDVVYCRRLGSLSQNR